MKLVKLDSIFSINYGTDLELNKLEKTNDGIPFVSRNRNHNGIVAYVKKINGISPNPAHSISVPLGSSSVLYAHYQEKEYYSGRDLAYLRPLDGINITMMQMFYYCIILRKNRIKYNYGRQVNTTLSSLLVPSIDSLPEYINSLNLPNTKQYKDALCTKDMILDYRRFKKFRLYPDYFDMTAGEYYEKSARQKGDVPLISSSDNNNGVAEMTNLEPVFEGNSITIGKVSCSAYYQPKPFCATSDCTVLTPKPNFNLNVFSGIFIATVINKERPKWNYGRQIRLNDCQNLNIFLPSTDDGQPDLQYMSDFIKTLKYSKFVGEYLSCSHSV